MHRLHAGVGGAGAVGAVDTVGADDVPLSMVSVCTTPPDQIMANDIMYAANSSAPKWILHLYRWFIVLLSRAVLTHPEVPGAMVA